MIHFSENFIPAYLKGSSPKPQAVAASAATETSNLAQQSAADELELEQQRRKRNDTVLASAKEASFGERLKLSV